MRVGIWFQAKMEVLYKPQVILLLFPQQMGHLFWSSLPSHSRGILAVIIRPDTVDSLSLCTPVPGTVHISSRLNLTATLSSLYYSSSPWQRWKRRLLPQMCQLVSAWAKASLFPHQHLTAPPGALTPWTQQPSFQNSLITWSASNRDVPLKCPHTPLYSGGLSPFLTFLTQS